MVHLGEVAAEFPWGWVLVSDRDSTNPIPDGLAPMEPVIALPSTLLVGVQHGQEGRSTVHVWSGNNSVLDAEVVPANSVQIFASRVFLSSGVMVVGDLTSTLQREFETGAGMIQLEIYVDVPGSARRVDLLTFE